MPSTIIQAIEQANYMLNSSVSYSKSDYQMIYAYCNYFCLANPSNKELAVLVNRLKEKL